MQRSEMKADLSCTSSNFILVFPNIPPPSPQQISNGPFLRENPEKAQAKNTKRATEWGVWKRNYSGSLNNMSNWLEWNFAKVLCWVKIEQGQAITPSAFTGIRAAITFVPLSRKINILQGSKLMSAYN